MAEIEHFVDPLDKSHPKYPEVADLEFLMFPREEQMSGQSAKRIPLRDAVSKVGLDSSLRFCFLILCAFMACFDRGIVNNETLGYFIGRMYHVFV